MSTEGNVLEWCPLQLFWKAWQRHHRWCWAEPSESVIGWGWVEVVEVSEAGAVEVMLVEAVAAGAMAVKVM